MSQADPTITLVLPLSFVNYALNCAADRPYREANTFIKEVQGQVEEALAPKPTKAPIQELDLS